MGGGQSAPLFIWLSGDIFFNRGLVLAVYGQDSKAQSSTLKILVLRHFQKTKDIRKILKNVKLAI